MQPLPLFPGARRLALQLAHADQQPTSPGQTFHVASIGSGFYFAYEQLRNAAEYREHHLLLRNAIERYLARYVKLHHQQTVGADLITELTQAGYLKNNTIPLAKLSQIDGIIRHYHGPFTAMLRTGNVDEKTLNRWFFQIISVQIEALLDPNPRLVAFMSYAYEHYLGAIDPAETAVAGKAAPTPGQATADEAYHIALYCAVQRALFKSDIATTRYYCLAASLADLDDTVLERFAAVNYLLDDLYQGARTNRIFRLINRYGAPMRILGELVLEPGAHDLADRADTLAKIKRVCGQQYALQHKRMRTRIIKTTIFVFITKVLLGISTEVPYDLFVHGAIAWNPLLLNVMFPLVYMIIIGLRMPTPGASNTEVIAGYVDRILYDGAGTPVEYRNKKRLAVSSLSTAFSVVYAIGFTISFGLLAWLLYALHFNIVNGFIFFIFLSAVSFLGFRLRQSARELAMLDDRQGLLQTFADFLSTPFVRIGYWLSDRYSKLNIVAVVLDTLIELPLKTTLRLIQQWISFMRDKQEEL